MYSIIIYLLRYLYSEIVWPLCIFISLQDVEIIIIYSHHILISGKILDFTVLMTVFGSYIFRDSQSIFNIGPRTIPTIKNKLILYNKKGRYT